MGLVLIYRPATIDHKQAFAKGSNRPRADINNLYDLSVMQTTAFPTESEVRLVAQRALLGEIPPHLRSVFDIADDGRLRGRFEFDGDPTDEERECASVVMTNFVAALSPAISLSEEFVSNTSPKQRNFLPISVYARNEHAWNSWTASYGNQ
ncbi:hypothetical protein [Pseudomonas viridiflava]|uniref:hypothetical protein n=1 Tax=Pseudomonas viridiflava TaxID=33069 RepID=UPI000F065229|nr:hypothetical protein [Pseudomonas viridiflava]